MTEPTHNPDCDVNDINPDGIVKPCNCGRTMQTESRIPERIRRLRGAKNAVKRFTVFLKKVARNF